jgi:MarR family transcriptional regulator, organic hydroperoxide resistance regulator
MEAARGYRDRYSPERKLSQCWAFPDRLFPFSIKVQSKPTNPFEYIDIIEIFLHLKFVFQQVPTDPGEPGISVAKEIVELLHELGKARGKATIAAWMELQLTLPQFKMLVIISKAESSTVGGIAEQLGVGEPTASYLIERLVQAGFAERAENPSDRRKAMIRLSPEGTALLERLQGPRNWLQDLLSDLDPEDLAALRRGLGAVVAKIPDTKGK